MKVKKLVLDGMFLALGLILPFLTGQIPQIGSMLLPMHIPVLLCGLICGYRDGALVGLITPILRHFLFGAPPAPMFLSMALELMTYGFLAGYVYSHSNWKCIYALLKALVIAMIGGRIVWGVAQYLILGLSGVSFTFPMFLTGAVTSGIPGIILQFILIPAIMLSLKKTGLIPNRHAHESKVKG